MGGDRTPTRQAPHDQEEDHEVDDEEEGDYEQDSIVEGGSRFDKTTEEWIEEDNLFIA